MAKAYTSLDPLSDSRQVTIQIERQFDPTVEASIIRDALKTAATTFAEKWIEENNDKIVERLNVDAIANMIMLEVAKEQTKNITHRSTQ